MAEIMGDIALKADPNVIAMDQGRLPEFKKYLRIVPKTNFAPDQSQVAPAPQGMDQASGVMPQGGQAVAEPQVMESAPAAAPSMIEPAMPVGVDPTGGLTNAAAIGAAMAPGVPGTADLIGSAGPVAPAGIQQIAESMAENEMGAGTGFEPGASSEIVSRGKVLDLLIKAQGHAAAQMEAIEGAVGAYLEEQKGQEMSAQPLSTDSVAASGIPQASAANLVGDTSMGATPPPVAETNMFDQAALGPDNNEIIPFVMPPAQPAPQQAMQQPEDPGMRLAA